MSPRASRAASGVAARTTFEVGDLVEVLPRTWAGINKPGGTGRITQVHYNAGFLESVDVAYVIGSQKDKKVDLEYIKAHVQLERVERSRRGRDFFKASPARGVRRGATRNEQAKPTSSDRSVVARRQPASKRRKVSMTAATQPTAGLSPSRDESDKSNNIVMVDVDESEAWAAPPKFAALADVPVLEIEIPMRPQDSDCVSPMDIADRFMRMGSVDDEVYEPYSLDDIQTDQIVPCPSPRELLARHEKQAARTISSKTEPTHAATGAKRSLYAATARRSKPYDEEEDDRKPSPKTDRKSLARSQSDSKLLSSLQVSQSAKSGRRKNSNIVKTPSARRILPLKKYRKTTAPPVTQSPSEEAPKRRKPLQQILQNRVDNAQKFVRSMVSGKGNVPPRVEVEADPAKPALDPARLEIFRNNLSKLWEGGDDVVEKDQIILELNTHLMTKGISTRIFTQSEIDQCLRTLEDEGILMLGAADHNVYRI